jgi:hypothetical protein
MIKPAWPAPSNIKAYSTTRIGGFSTGAFAQLNLGNHVYDDPVVVARNRAWLKEQLQLPAEPIWLDQVHGNKVINADSPTAIGEAADAAYASTSGNICAVLTADCLPLLICDQKGSLVAAVHAGWRGLANGIIESTIQALSASPNELLVWLGPAIGPKAFEVGQEVRDIFVKHNEKAAIAFQPSPSRRWLANLYQLATLRLQACGVNAIYGGEFCTYTNEKLFFSYRRDGVTGRMVSLIWIE